MDDAKDIQKKPTPGFVFGDLTGILLIFSTLSKNAIKMLSITLCLSLSQKIFPHFPTVHYLRMLIAIAPISI